MIDNVFEDYEIRAKVIEKELGVDEFLLKDCKVLIVAGDNACGKSLFRRFLSGFLGMYYKEKKINAGVVDISQEARSRSGDISKCFIYGDENYESTGQITCHSILGCFHNIKNNESWDEKVLIIDEPEIGLSEESQLGLATYIKTELQTCPAKLRGVVIITHSRYIVSELKDVEGFKFHYIGEKKYKDAEAWLDRKIEANDITLLGKISHDRYTKFRKALESKKKKKKT